MYSFPTRPEAFNMRKAQTAFVPTKPLHKTATFTKRLSATRPRSISTPPKPTVSFGGHQRKKVRCWKDLPKKHLRFRTNSREIRTLGSQAESNTPSQTQLPLEAELESKEEDTAVESSVSPDWYRAIRSVAIFAVVAVGAAVLTGRADAVGAGSTGGQDWRFFAAGSLAAALSHGYTTPIDVVKTRMQTNPELYHGSVIGATKTIFAENPAFLLQGLGPTLIGYGIEGGLKFGCYEFLKPVLSAVSSYTFLNFLICSVVAGALASIVLCPAEDVRIHQVADPDYGENPLEVYKRIIREKGIFSSFKGLPAMLWKQVPYTMAKQVSFDFVSSMLYSALLFFALDKYSMAPTFILVLSAFASSCLACFFSHPGDMVLTAFFKGDDSVSVTQTFKDILKKDGPSGLFRGIKARFFHVGAIITVQLCMYDIIKQMLGLAATGAH